MVNIKKLFEPVVKYLSRNLTFPEDDPERHEHIIAERPIPELYEDEDEGFRLGGSQFRYGCVIPKCHLTTVVARDQWCMPEYVGRWRRHEPSNPSSNS